MMDHFRATFRAVGLALSGAVLLGSAIAGAQTPVPASIFEREDAELFRPTTDGGDFLTVYDSKTLPPGHFSISGWGSYADTPLEVREIRSGDTVTGVVDRLGTLQLGGAIGVLPNVSLGMRAPLYFTDKSSVIAGGFTVDDGNEVSFGDLVLNGKLTLLDRDAFAAGLAIIPEITLPTGDADNFAGTGELGWGGLIALDFLLSEQARMGFNVGGVVRDEVGGGPFEKPGDAFNDQLRFGTSVSVDLDEQMTTIVELWGATDAGDPFGEERKTPVEAVGALRMDLGQVLLTFGGGGGLTRGQAAPKFRVFAGLTPPRPDWVAPIVSGADLSTSRKTYALQDRDGDDRATPGDLLEYRIHVRNTGVEPAVNVVVSDQIPDRTRYVSGTLAIEGQTMTDAPGDDGADFADGSPAFVTFRIAELSEVEGSNGVTVSFVVEIDPEISSVTTITNVPSITAEGLPTAFLDPAVVQVFPALFDREHVVVGRDKLELTNNIHFEFDKSVIQRKSYPILEELAGVLRDYPSLRIRIEGHTDSTGTEDYNQKLSERRALSVRDFLVGQGIDTARMEWVGRGELQPIATNDTATGRALNRRMEFWVLNPEALDGLELREKAYQQDLAPQSEPDHIQ